MKNKFFNSIYNYKINNKIIVKKNYKYMNKKIFLLKKKYKCYKINYQKKIKSIKKC